MKYEMEDLIPIVAKLAQSYTSGESTSITYDKAQQLMGAVLYSIHEAENDKQFSLIQGTEQSPESAYTIGAKCVEEKTKETLSLYNEMMTHFSSYENECLYDTVVKGLPEFFKWYDCKYEPQNTILTLDYPVLLDLSKQTGIDKIHDFILCIQLEQKFLNKFSTDYVTEVLSKYDEDYKRMIDNICEIVLMNVILPILAGKEISTSYFDTAEYSKMQELIQKEDLHSLRKKLKGVIEVFIQNHYENDENLMEYLFQAVDNISVRIKCAADHGNLDNIF